jgi:hypothetical protein
LQNRLKHAIGLADASVTSEPAMPNVAAQAGVVDAYALGSNLKGEFFMQFGLVNQMSRGVAGSMRAIDYAKDATACTVPANSEVLLRFTIGDPSVERECTGDEVLEFVCARTDSKTANDDRKLYYQYHKEAAHMHGRSKHGDGTHVHLSGFEDKALGRSIGDKEFWKTRREKYKEAGVIMRLIGVRQPKAKKPVENTLPVGAPRQGSIDDVPIQLQAGNGQNGNGEAASLRVSTQPKAARRSKASHPTSDKVLTMTQESDSAAHDGKEPKHAENVAKE